MKTRSGLLLVVCILLSCSSKISKDALPDINGYWEIENVELPDGGHKDYKINESIDFFQLNGKTGFRKKVNPQFDGRYLVNDRQEDFRIVETDDAIYLEYTMAFDTVRDEIISLTKDRLVLKNEQDLEFHYKKPTPFTLK